MDYEAVIGLEVHVQLNSVSKIFCGCKVSFGARPNTQTCPVCLSLPGVLPVLNRRAVECAIIAAIAFNCKILSSCKFHRKNYFYPDLPKAYQISQYDEPLATNGYIEIRPDSYPRRIGISRLHLEEDAAKLIHTHHSTLIDYNRCGIPLIEIVSYPELHSPDEAYLYLLQMKAILQYTGVSNCNMEEGSLRCDANLSLRPKGKGGFGSKVEIKNMNTFKGVKAALTYEIGRQMDILNKNGSVLQETRLWDPLQQKTIPMRRKEEAHDYRYFPEPDLVPLLIDREWIDSLKRSLPELPMERRERFIKEYGLSDYDADVLTQEKSLADFYEDCLKLYPKPKIVANWVMTELLGLVSEEKRSLNEVDGLARHMARILSLIDEGVISGKMAKDLLCEVYKTGNPPERIIEERKFIQISDEEEIKGIIDRVLMENKGAVEDLLNGKEKAMGFLVGQVMRLSQGRANPQIVNRLLQESLKACRNLSCKEVL